MALIIFDYFGVCVGEVAPRFFQNHFSEEEAKILKDQYFEPADLGLYTVEETIDRIAKDFNFNKEDIIKEWKSYAIKNEELFDYILKLKKKNTVALLSNGAKGIYELLFPDVDLHTYFDKIFISCDYKIKKPTLEFYFMCRDSYKEAFDAIYFIDDNIKNVACLKDTNITGIVYTSNEELFRVLKKYL